MEEIKWFEVCEAEALELDAVIGYEQEGRLYAIFHIEKGFYATDGRCTHEQASLIDGYVSDSIVECPKHNARFHIVTGKAMKRPACVDIGTYSVKIESGKVWIGLVS